MKRIRMVGLCLVAVFALGAIVASAAQAAGPEWGRCTAQKKGKYLEGNCQQKAPAKEKGGVTTYNGKYEWVSLVEEEAKHGGPWCGAQKKGNYTDPACTIVSEKKGVPNHKGHFEKYGPYFTGVGGSGFLNTVIEACYLEGVFEPAGRKAACDHANDVKNGEHNTKLPIYVECEGETNSGVARHVNEVENIQVTFKGCLLLGQVPCENTAKEGEIKTNTLKGRIGYLEKAAKPQPKVGVLLEPATTGGLFATMSCAGGIYEVIVGVGNEVSGSYYEGTGNDGIMAPVTPVNKSTPGFEQVFSTFGEGAENQPNQFEGETAIHDLESATTLTTESEHNEYGWTRAGQSLTNRVTTEGADEIKA